MKPNPAFLDDHEMNQDPMCEQMTVETFESVINKPATSLELEAKELERKVFSHPHGGGIFKNLVRRYIETMPEEFELHFNEAVIKHPLVDPVLTVCLDIKLKDD